LQAAADILTTSKTLNIAFPAVREPLSALIPHATKITTILQGAEPRWIILGDPANALPVLKSWRPFKFSSQVQWNAVLLASSVKLLSRLPNVRSDEILIDKGYWQERLQGFSDKWDAVLHVGNSSYTRKAIVFFIGEDASIKAVAKVPLTSAAGEAIINEAHVLQHMRTVQNLARVLFEDAPRGVAAQTFLDGKAVSRKFTAEHVELLGRLANAGATTRLPEFRPFIVSSLEALDLPVDRSLMLQALDFLDFDEELPEFVEHRDFAPWNLKRLRNGSLTLLDWEWAVEKSLPCQDLCRYFYIQDVLFHGPGTVWKTLTSDPLIQKHLQRSSIPPAALPGLSMHYLLRVLCMDWKNKDRLLTDYTLKQIRFLVDLRRSGADKL
jgi:hypothetical protein